MKNLKLRAWSKTEKIMSDVKKIDFNNGEVDARSFEETAIEEVELMSSTGLYDKNGQEIFEGDIITKDEGENLGIVRYGVCHTSLCFYVEGNYKGSELTYPINPNFPRYYKVIGNIYENEKLVVRAIRGK